MLDRAYTGLVFGLSARIHVLVQDIETTAGVELSEIVVRSPQFKDAVWNYGYYLAEDDGGMEVTQIERYVSSTSQEHLGGCLRTVYLRARGDRGAYHATFT